jgi:glutamyl-tRNA reductase
VKVLALGVDHRSSPTAVREALAVGDREYARALAALKAEFPGHEFVLLSTCNRVELYAAGDGEVEGGAPEVGPLTEALARFHGVRADAVLAHLVDRHDAEAVGHLFRVAASLESLVLGEGQILGQVKEAHRAAQAAGAVGPTLNALFQQALRVGKKVREATGMDRGKLSIASVAVDVARDVFDTFGDKTVLVIGAGKMADLTLRHLKGLRPGRILVTNRSPERAEAAAAKWGGRAVPIDELYPALVEADVVVSTTAAERPIVAKDLYARVQRARRNRLALILDIAVPRDFEASIGDLDQVLLYNVDDLRAQAEQNRKAREQGIDPALAIIEAEAAACWSELRHRRLAGATLRQLGDRADDIVRRELDALVARNPHFTDADRAAIAHALGRAVNQLLHPPRAALRSTTPPADADAHPHSLLHALRHLFGLADG